MPPDRPWTLNTRGLLILLGLAACRHPVNTIPAPASPTDPIEHYALEIPDALEIKAVSFQATAFSDISGGANMTVTQVGGRAFLEVYAVHRQTGEQYLLIYEDVDHRKTPVRIIRFHPVSDARLLTP